MADQNHSAQLVSMPMKANGAALAAFFALSSDIFDYAGRDWLSLSPGWLFSMGVVFGYLIVMLFSVSETHYRNINVIILNEQLIASYEARVNLSAEEMEDVERIRKNNERIRQSLKSQASLENIPKSVQTLSTASYACLLLGIFLALIAMSR
jgi:hypothetical protein